MALRQKLDYSLLEWHSTPSLEYNCIGWAIGDPLNRYWPYDEEERKREGWYWPDGVLVGDTVESMEDLLTKQGRFRPSSTKEALVGGIEKVALYVYPDTEPKALVFGYEMTKPEIPRPRKPSHMAWQLDDGRWTSKLANRGADYLHRLLQDVESVDVGEVYRFYERPRERIGFPPDPWPESLGGVAAVDLSGLVNEATGREAKAD